MAEEWVIRAIGFAVVFAVVAAWEVAAPRRPLQTSKARRWGANLTLVALNPLSVRLVFPLLPVGLAATAAEQGWGLLNRLDVTFGLKLAAGLLVLDLAVYLQHVLHHAVPALWRLHMVHHADLDFDLTTGIRFHPVEIVISMAVKLGVVAALGPPAAAVLVFEVVLNAASMFNHGNIRLPESVDKALRRLLVTPDMHRVHHSVSISETNSNYGFCLAWWDRLFGTYKDQPAKGHMEMTIGLSQFRDARRLSLPRLLLLPFSGDPGRVPINRH
jgi:sterol desaturase/sphingolipid hydroxylase (fatty acid hydroxylase superfamily)